MPDSLMLATPYLPGGWKGELYVAYRDANGTEVNHRLRSTPRADTLRARVVGTSCVASGQPKMILLEHDDVYLYVVNCPCAEYGPLQTKAPGGGLTGLYWSTGHQRLSTAHEQKQSSAAFNARQREERRARAEQDSLASAAESRAREAARTKRIRAYGWSKAMTDRVLAREVSIGMTTKMLIEAWGEPEDVNSTILPGGTREQWVYGLGTYVYVEKGIVRAIQN